MVSSSNSNATMQEVISGNNIAGSGTVSGNNSSNGAGAGCRTNEWTVSSSSTNQQSQSSIATNALNTREVPLNSSSILTVNELGLSSYPFLQSGNSGNGGGSNIMSLSVSGGAGVNGNGIGADGQQSQYLLTKFMQPTLSDVELAQLEKDRANR